jgi:signal transduction histidine kinase
MNLRFKGRIALLNTIAGAFSALVVFMVVYFVVFQTSLDHLDADIRQEAAEVIPTISGDGDSLLIGLLPEWEEREHRQLEVNPTFLQVVQLDGKRIFHSANLFGEHLSYDTTMRSPVFFKSEINRQPLRVGQFPLLNERREITGFLSVGVSRKESMMVLKNLRTTLVISYPVLLLALFLTSSLTAAQSIQPVKQLIQAASGISDATISDRLPLPPHKDEIYFLAATINDLLQRIENGLTREKQFTSDASHELRTPLAGIKGTLEVLLRKQRDPAFYEEKIGKVLQEADRMDSLLDQLLQLARLESGNTAIKLRAIPIAGFLREVLDLWREELREKQIRTEMEIPEEAQLVSDRGLLELIAGNLVSNAAKYGKPEGVISFSWDEQACCLSISDDGPGIPASELGKIFDRFYRSAESLRPGIKGSGLGLSIAKKTCDLLHIRIEAANNPEGGLIFRLYFPKQILS